MGQIANFIENLHLSYTEVVYTIPYRNLLLMSADKARIATGTVKRKISGKEMAERRKK